MDESRPGPFPALGRWCGFKIQTATRFDRHDALSGRVSVGSGGWGGRGGAADNGFSWEETRVEGAGRGEGACHDGTSSTFLSLPSPFLPRQAGVCG